jgi:hypothetical protein
MAAREHLLAKLVSDLLTKLAISGNLLRFPRLPTHLTIHSRHFQRELPPSLDFRYSTFINLLEVSERDSSDLINV